MRELGVIFGEVEARSFKFNVTGEVKQSDYVKVFHIKDGWVLSQVTSLTKFLDDENEKLVAKASVIGYKDSSGVLRVPKIPFSPGDKIFAADQELISKTLGLGVDPSSGAYIGMLEGTDVKVFLRINNLVSRHASILAKTGSGKSYAAAVIIEELLEKGVPLVIIDPHGEYLSLREKSKSASTIAAFEITPKGYAPQITVYTPANLTVNPGADKIFRLDSVNLSARVLHQLLPDVTSKQIGIVHQSINKIKEQKELYSLSDIIEEVSKNDSSEKWGLINSLEALRDTGIVSDNPTTIDELVQRGRASIIDMKGITPELQGIIVARVCEELFEARKVNKVPPVMLVVEEAHDFCPEKGYRKVASSDVLRTIASEGRKFGLGLMVISQRPARVDKNVLSQCGTQIILKVTNPNDIKALSKGLEGFTAEMSEEIKRLPPGVALLVSGDIEKPVVVNIRPRRSEHGGRSVSVVEDE